MVRGRHMRNPVLSARRRHLLTSLLLAVLLFRAYVPVGFMPASGTPFMLELCPAAAPMPMSMLRAAHHSHHSDTTHNQFQSCPFGSAPAAGPIAHLIAFAPPASIVSPPLIAAESPRISVRFDRANPPRGPPSLT
jgi:hypothetical protein